MFSKADQRRWYESYAGTILEIFKRKEQKKPLEMNEHLTWVEYTYVAVTVAIVCCLL